MDRLNSFSRVIVDSTQELCAMLVSSYIEKVKDTCKNGEEKSVQTGRLRSTDSLGSRHVHTCQEFLACVSHLTYVLVFNTKPSLQTRCAL